MMEKKAFVACARLKAFYSKTVITKELSLPLKHNHKVLNVINQADYVYNYATL